MSALNHREGARRIDTHQLFYAVRGISTESSDALRRIIAMLLGRTQCQWHATTLAAADIIILGPDADAAMPNERAARCTVRVMSGDSQKFGDGPCLEYPFRVFQVLSAMVEVEARLGSETAASENSVARNPSWALFDSIRALSGQSSCGQWYCARYPDGRALYVRDDLRFFAADASVHGALADGQLPQAALLAGLPPAEELPQASGKELLWHVGLHSGRGNLSASLDPNCGYRLKVWPDFGVLRPHRLHLRLSAAMTSAAHTRTELVELMGGNGDAQAVNRFLNACAASGLLHVERRELALAVPAKRAPSSFMQGLVASIRQKLGFGR